MKCSFSQFLSATMGPLVALVSTWHHHHHHSHQPARPETAEEEESPITCSDHHSAIVDASHNRCASRGGFRKWHALGVQSRIAGVVGEVEAGHEAEGIDAGSEAVVAVMVVVVVVVGVVVAAMEI